MTDKIALTAIANALRNSNAFAQISIPCQPGLLDTNATQTPSAQITPASWSTNWSADAPQQGEQSVRTTSYEVAVTANPQDQNSPWPGDLALIAEAILHNLKLVNPADPNDCTLSHYCESGRYSAAKPWTAIVTGQYSYLSDQPTGQPYHPPSYFPPSYFAF